MTSYSKFDEEIYSEELYPVTEIEYEEAMRQFNDDVAASSNQEESERSSSSKAMLAESLTCYFCQQPIAEGQKVEQHHYVYKSQGGTETKPTHKACHRSHHIIRGDFREWGRLSSLCRRWSINLLNVRTHPAYQLDRQFYMTYYAK